MTEANPPRDDGWLPGVVRVPSPHIYPAGHSQVKPATLAVCHWTASPRGTDPHGAHPGRVERWLAGKGSESSTHFVVLRDGRIYQGAPLTARTWHAGASSWGGRPGSSVNPWSIGLDVENLGPVRRFDGSWRDIYGLGYHGPEPVQHGAAWYEPLAAPQTEALLVLVSELARRIPALRDPAAWVGHCDVSPGRKSDPGPAFPWDRVRSAVARVAQANP